MKQATMLPVMLILSHALVVNGASLRRRESSTAIAVSDPAKPEEIQEKWDKMDEFLEVMFTMACKWKHGKDVAGAAAEKLKNGEVDGAAGYAQEVKDIQAENVKGLEGACGMIVADGKKKCRLGCANRWNASTVKREDCDEKCVKVYANFERSCKSKADDLVKVYDMKSTKAAAQKQCYEGHCNEFPMVWMKAEESEMTAEVEKQCTSRCTDDNVKAGCQKAWALEVDMEMSTVAADCAAKSGVKKCFDKKKADVSSDYDTCKSKTEGDCDKAYTECKTKGKVDKTFKDAKAFCDDRKKMCLNQANEKCLAENKEGLEKAQKECDETAGTEYKTCKDDALKTKKEDHEKKCIAEHGPKCKDDCKGKCQVTKMNKCLEELKFKEDPGKMFCKDFWHLLHTTSEVDPVTGNPIVLLQSKVIEWP